METLGSRIWISWENHRRSRELADAFNAELIIHTNKHRRWLRYPTLSFKTARLVLTRKPKLIFCQNPSIVLTTLLVILKKITGFKLVVDRHSNFKLNTTESKHLKWKIFHLLSNFTIKNSDLTIVTNEFLKKLCESVGSQAVILQDKLPVMNYMKNRNTQFNFDDKVHKIMVVATFDDDEPIDEIVEAGINLSSLYRIYITGNYLKKLSEVDRDQLKKQGVILTGYIAESEYQSLMHCSDAIVVLTKEEFILNCGAYEALALKKPFVVSNTETLRQYFRKGCIYTEISSTSIKDSIEEVIRRKAELTEEIETFIPELIKDWNNRFKEIQEIVNFL
ncbi:glycosyltransferase [Marinobacter sp. DY40_1A1]|uniref:glycosyltransferase n=1 Tax=Marinobacter sp. DY40_1A1 TaxID=2583229 RepID=UPI001908D4AB|nr:glycosyltransferase [Marinobacter sp. DY40_1A1]MBK1885946.1 glycosyltransferase [Marinobacter sp. DY40_1A1]